MSESQELAQPNTVEVGETATFREPPEKRIQLQQIQNKR